MKKNFNKLLALCGILATGAVFAAETTGSSTTGLISSTSETALEGMFTTAQSNLSSMLDNAIPVIVAFVVGGLVIWGAIALIGVLKRAFSAGKGR